MTKEQLAVIHRDKQPNYLEDWPASAIKSTFDMRTGRTWFTWKLTGFEPRVQKVECK